MLGQFYTLLGALVFLALDGHLALIEMLVDSFRGLPSVPHGLSLAGACTRWPIGAIELFPGALRVALPGMTALLVVNLAFGVMSRAAPALNLFAVGFPDHAGGRLRDRAVRAARHADGRDRSA